MAGFTGKDGAMTNTVLYREAFVGRRAIDSGICPAPAILTEGLVCEITLRM